MKNKIHLFLISLICFSFYNFIECKIILCFGIMIYQKESTSIEQTIESFNRLFDSIYPSSSSSSNSNSHLYVIHLDIKSDRYIHQYIQDFCSLKSNCIKIYSRNIAWGSLSTGEMMLALMQEGYESNIKWDYFILLGHESLPLVNLNQIENILEHYPIGTNFMNCWNVKGYNFFGQYERNNDRIRDIFIDNFAGSMIKLEGQRSPPSDIIFYKSLQQVILSSKFVQFVIYGSLTKRIMLYLTNVNTADEMILPTLLQVILINFLFFHSNFLLKLL